MKAKNTNKKAKILLLTLWISGLFLTLNVNAQIVWAKEITAENVIELVNKEREFRKLEILKEDYQLSEAAQEKSEDMITNNYFAHTSPGGITPWHWIEKNGYDYIYAGENLAINFSSAEDQHKAWMKSSEHRKNIINPNYKEIGVAVKEGCINGKAAVVTVQMFGAGEVKAGVLSQASKEAENKTGSVNDLTYKTAELGASSNPEFRKTAAQVENGEEKSRRMVIVMGDLSNSQNIFGDAVWIILPMVLIFSVILNIITVINFSRYHYSQFHLTKF